MGSEPRSQRLVGVRDFGRSIVEALGGMSRALDVFAHAARQAAQRALEADRAMTRFAAVTGKSLEETAKAVNDLAAATGLTAREAAEALAAFRSRTESEPAKVRRIAGELRILDDANDAADRVSLPRKHR